MSIATIVTRGFGNGAFDGSVSEIVTMGYTIAEFILWTVKPDVTTAWDEQANVVTSWNKQSDVSTTWTIKPPS